VSCLNIEAKTIARMQYRLSTAETQAWTQSVFHNFENGIYFLQIYEHERNLDNPTSTDRFELNVGTPVPSDSFDWLNIIGRTQKWSHNQAIWSGGVQIELNKIEKTKKLLDSVNTYSFLQFFGKNESSQLGNAEILHYYQINTFLSSQWSIRGYNIAHFSDDEILMQHFADIIYPFNENCDVYFRWTYASQEKEQIGKKGHTAGIGIRLNFID
jgi:hypothetical protein